MFNALFATSSFVTVSPFHLSLSLSLALSLFSTCLCLPGDRGERGPKGAKGDRGDRAEKTGEINAGEVHDNRQITSQSDR